MSSSTITAAAKPQATGDAKLPAAGDVKFARGTTPQATGDAKLPAAGNAGGSTPQATGDAKLPAAKAVVAEKVADVDINSDKRPAHNALCRVATDIEAAALKGDSAALKKLIPRYIELLEIVRKLCLIGASLPLATEKLSEQLHIGLFSAQVDLFEAKQRNVHADCILRLSACVGFGYGPDDKLLSAQISRASMLTDTDEKMCQMRVYYIETLLRVAKSIGMDEDASAAENK